MQLPKPLKEMAWQPLLETLHEKALFLTLKHVLKPYIYCSLGDLKGVLSKVPASPQDAQEAHTSHSPAMSTNKTFSWENKNSLESYLEESQRTGLAGSSTRSAYLLLGTPVLDAGAGSQGPLTKPYSQLPCG